MGVGQFWMKTGDFWGGGRLRDHPETRKTGTAAPGRPQQRFSMLFGAILGSRSEALGAAFGYRGAHRPPRNVKKGGPERQRDRDPKKQRLREAPDPGRCGLYIVNNEVS